MAFVSPFTQIPGYYRGCAVTSDFPILTTSSHFHSSRLFSVIVHIRHKNLQQKERKATVRKESQGKTATV
jgi:hypothetical protein